jgi:signal transduction histidine kinase
VFDELGRASVANPAVNGLLERPESRILGATIDQLMDTVAAENQVEVKELFSPTAVQSVPLNVEWGGRTLSLSVAPLQAGQAGVGGTVAVFRDVTREAEVSRMKSIIVAMVSHELRTPLNAVQGLAEVLQQGVYGRLADKQQVTIDRIIINTKRLMSLVRDVLDQAQIEAGTLKIESVLFSPSELVDAVREVVGGLAKDKGLQFLVTIDEALPSTLVGDPQRLGQILINLTNNAIKFTETGSVSIRLYQFDLVHWAMEVADTGPGIPISAEAYIYDAFRQIDSSGSRRHGGIGLGLSIVKRLVTVMEGDIKLSSRLGRGSTFTVLLPLVHPGPHLLT